MTVPHNTKNSVLDAWNGYHSVAIREEDRHITTFYTKWGRYRYRSAPSTDSGNWEEEEKCWMRRNSEPRKMLHLNFLFQEVCNSKRLNPI